MINVASEQCGHIIIQMGIVLRVKVSAINRIFGSEIPCSEPSLIAVSSTFPSTQLAGPMLLPAAGPP